MTVRVALTWLVVLAAASPGCSSQTPMEERSALLLAQVKESVREGSATVRCNPVECDCPPLEIRVADRWIRVDVVDSSDPDLPVEGIVRFCKAEAAGPLPQSHTWQVDLKSSSVRWCANGTPYFELALKSLNPDAE